MGRTIKKNLSKQQKNYLHYRVLMMVTIKDLTGQSNKKNLDNKKRFIDRYKSTIRKKVKNIAAGKSLKDFKGNTDITISDTEEPGIVYDRRTGDESIIFPGNDQLKKGQTIPKPKSSSSSRGGSGDGSNHEDFTFTITKQEFLELYFGDLKLPDFIKESNADNKKYIMKRGGLVKEAPQCRLNIKRTLLNSLARKFSSKKKKIRFLDDTDLVYDNLVKVPKPVLKCAMFCIMDVSYSMGELELELAKKFYLILYLFLEREYEQVDLVFILHTDVAREATETEFFSGNASGGTIISSAYYLTNKIIDSRYSLDDWNIYLAQASDGDNFFRDDEEAIKQARMLLEKVQYFCFIWVNVRQSIQHSRLLAWLIFAENAVNNLAVAEVQEDEDIYPVFRELFKG